MANKPLFTRVGTQIGQTTRGWASKAGQAVKSGRFNLNKLTEEQINELLIQNPSISRGKNLWMAEDLDMDQLEQLVARHCSFMNDNLFKQFSPMYRLSKRDALDVQLGKIDEDKINNILQATSASYKMSAMKDVIGSDYEFSLERHYQLLAMHAFLKFFQEKNRLHVLYDYDISDRKKIIKDVLEHSEEANEYSLGDFLMEEAIKKLIKDGKIISILKEAEATYTDVAKIADKYSIRLGDGKHFVASDEVQVVMRDPSENPAWALWFLSAVPLAEVPDRAKLCLMPEESRKKYYPKVLDDHPIICHASLWQLGQQSGCMLHTSWNHISVAYRWKIDKPIEVAALLFKAVSHPAHIARNFGYAPQVQIPGEEWFFDMDGIKEK